MGLRKGKSRAPNNGASLVRLERGTCGGLPNVQAALNQLFAGGGGIVSADLSSLAALPATVGGLVYVETLLCYFHRNQLSTLTPDGITVIAANGGGNWERLVPTTALDWLSQAAWYIDSAAGDDENAGDVANPLATSDELNRRLSVGSLQQNTTVTIVEGTTLDHFVLNIDIDTYSIDIVGEPTLVTSDTVSAYSARNHATPVGYRMEATGIADWTPYVGMRVRGTSGASTGAYCWVAREDPQGAGLDVARISQPSGLPFGSLINLVPGDSFVIETFPSIGSVTIDITGRDAVYLVNRIVIRDVEFGYNSQIITYLSALGFDALVFGCNIDGAAGVATFDYFGAGKSLNLIASCVQNATNIAFRESRFLGGLLRSAGQSEFTSNYPLNVTDTLFDGTTLNLVSDNETFDDCQWFDTGDTALTVQSSCVLFQNGASGNGNTIGIGVGWFGLVSGNYIGYSGTTNIVGTTTDIRIEGSPDLDLSWSDMPYDGNGQKGVGTLVAGTATISARGANDRGVVVSKNTASGTAQGVLEAPVASRTSAQFVVNARDAAGAIETNDTSSFDWIIPAEARGVVIAARGSHSAAG